MKYSTIFALAAMPVVGITSSYASEAETLVADMVDCVNAMTATIEQTTADNVAEKNAEMKQHMHKLQELTNRSINISLEESEAMAKNRPDLKAAAEQAKQRMNAATQALLKKDPAVFAALFAGVMP